MIIVTALMVVMNQVRQIVLLLYSCSPQGVHRWSAGTSACPNGAFYCPNVGFKPLVINSTFVDDGVCDCCDGTDEPPGRCISTCRQKGNEEVKMMQQKLSAAMAGAHKRSQYIDIAVKKRQEWSTSLEQKMLEVEIKRKEVESLKKSKEVIEAEERLLKDQQTKAQEVETPVVLENPISDNPVIDSTNSEEVEVKKEETSEELAKRVASQWIPQNNGDDEEVEEHDEELGIPVEDEFSYEEEDSMAEDDYPEEEQHEEKEDGNPIVLPLPSVGWIAKIKSLVSKVFQMGRPVLPKNEIDGALTRLQKQLSDARLKLTAEESTLRQFEKDIKELEDNLKRSYGPDDVFAVLVGTCIETTVDKYRYEICPFKSAVQKEGSASYGTTLGNWEGFSEDGTVLLFTHGAHCWQGPNRSMHVTLQCGETEVVKQVEEPNRCEYTAILETPAVCTSEYVATIKRRVETAQEWIVQTDHDEL